LGSKALKTWVLGVNPRLDASSTPL